MPLFRYEVTDRSGNMLRGAMNAESEAEVRQRLSDQGYLVNLVVSTAPPQQPAQPRPHVAPVPVPAAGTMSRATAPAKEMAVFFRGLASFLTAGVNLHEALVQIGMQTPNRGMRRICQELAGSVQAGHRLSVAMARFPRAFPPHVIGVVAAGELGGFLPIMVGDVALDYEIARRASSRFRKWVIWLGWINAIGTFAIAPALPIMAPILTEQGLAGLVPGMIAWLIWAAKYVLLPFALLYLLYFGVNIWLGQPSMRPIAHSMILRVPRVGRASRERSLASFTRILWRLQKAGILPIQAWEAACNAPENVVVGARLREHIPALRSGMKFSEALAATGYFTSEDQRVLALGEQTGQTADVLERISAYYEDAALTSAGSAGRLAIHFMIIVNLIALGVAAYCIEGLMTMRTISLFEDM